MATAVIDLGSGFVKAGLQTDSSPSCIFPSFVGRPRRRFAEYYEGDAVFIGEDIIENRSSLSVDYLIDHGHVDNYDDLEKLLSYTLNIGLPFTPAENSVLVTEPPFASTRHREAIAQSMFESFDVAEVNLSVQGAIAIYATGRTTGLVVEIGDGVTQIVPVHEGFTDKCAIRRNDFGGQEITMYLQKLLCDNGYPLTTRDEYEYARLLKDQHGYVALDPATEDQRDDLQVEFTLPDGALLRDGRTTITLSSELFYCTEALFEPRLVQRDNPALIELIWQSAQAAPIEARKSILGSVILSGGSTLFPGMKERIEYQLRELCPSQTRSSVKILASEDRLFGVWLGAKLFSDPGLRSMQTMFWMTREEWMEEGPSIIDKKTLLRMV